MREIRTLGSVRAKAEWLSYSTTPEAMDYLLKREGAALPRLLNATKSKAI